MDGDGFPTGASSPPAPGRRRLGGLLVLQLALVVLDLLLGIAVGVSFGTPARGSPPSGLVPAVLARLGAALTHGPFFLVHTLVGAGTWVLALAVLVGAARLRDSRLLLWLAVTAAGVTAAAVSGIAYLLYGNPSDSFLMFVGWMAALAGSLGAWASDLPDAGATPGQ